MKVWELENLEGFPSRKNGWVFRYRIWFRGNQEAKESHTGNTTGGLYNFSTEPSSSPLTIQFYGFRV